MLSNVLPGTSAAYFVPTSQRDSALCRQGSGSETKISHFTAEHDKTHNKWTLSLAEFNRPCWGFSRQSRREQRTSFHTTRWGASFRIRFLQTTQSCNSEAWSPASQRCPAGRNKGVSCMKELQPWHCPNISMTCRPCDSRCGFQPLCTAYQYSVR